MRETLAAFLDAQPGIEVVAQASDEHEVLRLLSEQACHLVILAFDIEESGPTVVQTIKRRHGDLPILLLSQGSDHSRIFDSLEVGANGCVPKSATSAEFLEAMREVAGGGSYLHPFIAQSVIRRLRNRSPENETKLLTAREQEIMAMLARGGNNEQIAKALHVSLSTVKSHLRTAYRKLGAADRTQAVLLALKLKVISDPR
jgi:DNA-binding NarL/FixJ family response regulator